MEHTRVNILWLGAAVCLGLAPIALAQRGMGDASGMVRQGLTPKTVTLQGKVVRIVTGPCKNTTGRSDIGTHFILKLEQGQEANIHLGPAPLVKVAADLLANGSIVSVKAFRTDKMPKDHYNAVTVTVGNKTLRLRHPNLKPVWAGEPVNKQNTISMPPQGRPHEYTYIRPFDGRRNASRHMARGQGRGQGCRRGRHRCAGRPRYGMRRSGRW